MRRFFAHEPISILNETLEIRDHAGRVLSSNDHFDEEAGCKERSPIVQRTIERSLGKLAK